jgi:hypothetical protein
MIGLGYGDAYQRRQNSGFNIKDIKNLLTPMYAVYRWGTIEAARRPRPPTDNAMNRKPGRAPHSFPANVGLVYYDPTPIQYQWKSDEPQMAATAGEQPNPTIYRLLPLQLPIK